VHLSISMSTIPILVQIGVFIRARGIINDNTNVSIVPDHHSVIVY
jgi:hypothetical protein